jgi:hypothetical protein
MNILSAIEVGTRFRGGFCAHTASKQRSEEGEGEGEGEGELTIVGLS